MSEPVVFHARGWKELETPALPAGAVHLWATHLNQSARGEAQLRAALSPAEGARADRFHFAHHRRNFVVSHAFTRRVLAAYLGTAPRAVVFTFGAQGKPSVSAPATSTPLHFNLSHTDEMAVVALARQPLGVDIETVRTIDDCEQLAGRFFSRREYEVLLKLPQEQRALGFFQCWTRKEAFIKAIGTGLSTRLDSFEVTLTPETAASFVRFQDHLQIAAPWELLHFEPRAGVVGAVATPFKIHTVSATLLRAD